MNVYCRGFSRVRHGEDGDIYDIESDQLDRDAVGADERQMGLETGYKAVVEHPELGCLTCSLRGYPAASNLGLKIEIFQSRINDLACFIERS